jgi:uncharacterized membrane protein
VLTFLSYFSLTYVAVTLLTTGIGHFVSFSAFRAIVQTHGLIPTVLSTLVSVAVVAFELLAGSAAIATLFWRDLAFLAVLLFAVCAAVGWVFLCYVWRLLRHPVGVTSCGCSPFEGPLTPASIIPAGALILVALTGLATSGCRLGLSLTIVPEAAGIAMALPLAWGGTLAGIIMLFPITMPQLTAGTTL